ncbi:MAG: methylenetetrahydrofolate dehydrogenase (NADP+) / methenyltetrahydrofolate cyclohydrolase [Parcubacteria group bacterium Greene0416_79]|nr:MAG: methylenetetrahydrofolate dehydrogenase (NADP+) / methenyltetrahydrofolate cyclohydrolase [Parcubacteria group bacterium Greene0416_79]
MVLILDGRKVRDEIAVALRRKIGALSDSPRLAIVQVGSNKESSAYIRQKELFGEKIKVKVAHRVLPVSVSSSEVLSVIGELNQDRTVHGIIIQLPLPDSLDRQRLLDAIAPAKDVDGLGSEHVALRGKGTPYLWPATARGIIELLDFYAVPIEGRRAAMLGRSALVGTPTAEYLRQRGAEVTVCHSQTADTKEIARASDIVVVAIGKPKLIGAEYFRDDKTQVVVDVGINSVGGAALQEEVPRQIIVGDLDFDAVKERVAALSPVPGGVGPMTVAALFENLTEAYERQRMSS